MKPTSRETKKPPNVTNQAETACTASCSTHEQPCLVALAWLLASCSSTQSSWLVDIFL
jgi:hypothetical protein